MSWWNIVTAAAPSLLCSLLMLFINKKLNRSEENRKKRDKEALERQGRTESLLMAILSSQKATNTLATATARAVQRIPDAKCNGDMKAALEEATVCQNEETKLLMEIGISGLRKR